MPGIKGKFAKTYDSFVKRISPLPGGLREMIASHGGSEILEFGVGTGTIAAGLAMLGYEVTGVDISSDMLKQAQAKIKNAKVNVRLIRDDIVKVDLKQKFDIIICLGNTLPLITPLTDSRRLFRNCLRHLKHGGILIFQQLNYDRILKDRPAYFDTDLSGDTIRIKQYRYGKTTIDFVVSLIDISAIPPFITTRRNKIRPWTKIALSSELKKAGFGRIRAYGSYARERYSLKSRDLILVAQKP